MYDLLVSFACYANDNDAFVPEVWAMEGLATLEENMIMAQLVHRDFSNEVANFGDVVNTRKVGVFKNYRKTDSDSVTAQNANATNVPVTLNLHNYINFTIKDGEASKSFKDLVAQYLKPGAQGIARGIDRMLCGQAQAFEGNEAGKLDVVTSSTARDYLLECREVLNRNNAYLQDRSLVLGPAAETLLLQTDILTKANERGDGGLALEEARLGRILGFNTYMDQNAGGLYIKTDSDVLEGVINNGAGYAAGTATSLTINFANYETVIGEFTVPIEDGQVTWTTARTTSTHTTAVTLHKALKYALTNATVITCWKGCKVNQSYAVGYSKPIAVDGHTASKGPQVGQLIAFGITTGTRDTYTVIERVAISSTETQVTLDRPLETLLTDEDACFPGPVGGINFAFHRDAIALVSRPLALPRAAGVDASVVDYNGVSMRVAMQYDIASQGTKVTLDLLCGVQVLDTNLGCVYLT